VKIAKKDMTDVILKNYLNYDDLTGHFTWKVKHCSKVIIGQRAGSASPYGHRVINLFGCLYPEHRLAWLYMKGSLPKTFIDHIDHNEHNNIFSNLREVSQEENNVNNSLRCDNTSGQIGIYINKRKHKHTYQVDVHTGTIRLCKAFKTMEQAIAARDAFYKENGFHINHGIPKPT
jgi:hypothetical protein